MLGIIICTHADLASGLKNALEMIAEQQEALKAICFRGDEDLLSLGQRIKEAGKEFTEGYLCVCDLVNATPFNAALIAVKDSDNIIISGASLPLLLELVILRRNFHGKPAELAAKLSSAENYVTVKHPRDVFK